MKAFARLPGKPPKESSVREHVAWTYGTLVASHAAIKEGKTSFEPRHFAIYSRFRRDYMAGDMKMRSLVYDEKTKIVHGRACCYCGCEAKLSMDHMIPRLRGGSNAADNIVFACRSCNSSKGSKDMVMWLVSKGRFPGLRVFRRYLKLGARWCENENLMDEAWVGVSDAAIPFDKRSLRIRWPELSELRLWPDPP